MHKNPNGGFTLVEILVVIAIIGLLASILLPTLSRGKNKANRIKCINNLGQISKATMSFANDNQSRLPWQLTPNLQQYHFAGNYKESLGHIFAVTAMKMEIQDANILLSPCDEGRRPASEKLETNWGKYNTAGGNVMPNDAISYVLIRGADQVRPVTVLAATRNLSTCDIATSRWVGANENPVQKHAMTGLNKGRGQLVLADGSATFAADTDLGEGGQVVKAHIDSTGGITIGRSSTRIIGECAGPNQRKIGKLIVEVSIDYWDELHIAPAGIFWKHKGAGLPGLYPHPAGRDHFTHINGATWLPTWRDEGDGIHGPPQDSSVWSTNMFPILPNFKDIKFETIRVVGRWKPPSVKRVPSENNGYLMVIEFDDRPPGGSDWYVIELSIFGTLK